MQVGIKMKLLLWILSRSCYYLGDLASRILVLFDNAQWCYVWYPIYSKFMKWSAELQGEMNTANWSWQQIKDE